MELLRVRQQFKASCIADVYAQTMTEITAQGTLFAKGERIAIAVGSRGIASLAHIVRAAVDSVQRAGAQPFIFPAMGSHGGATAEGQRAVLHGYGIHEQSMGCPIVSSMDVVCLHDESPRVYMARDAWHADGIIAINRVKPHTDFHGTVESGLVKMLVIGMGKHAQAIEMHSMGVPGLRDEIPIAAARVLQTGKVRLGIGVVENAYDKIAHIAACKGVDIPKTDSALLAQARHLMPSLPIDQIDILLVDRIGKDISGTGLDTNVIGRMRIAGEPEPQSPTIGMIIADSLTPASHGNALGVGLCDIITERLYRDIDRAATTENVVTSGFLLRGNIPVVARDVAQAMQWARRSLRIAEDALRIIRIESTLALSEFYASRAAIADMATESARLAVFESDTMQLFGNLPR